MLKSIKKNAHSELTGRVCPPYFEVKLGSWNYTLQMTSSSSNCLHWQPFLLVREAAIQDQYKLLHFLITWVPVQKPGSIYSQVNFMHQKSKHLRPYFFKNFSLLHVCVTAAAFRYFLKRSNNKYLYQKINVKAHPFYVRIWLNHLQHRIFYYGYLQVIFKVITKRLLCTSSGVNSWCLYVSFSFRSVVNSILPSESKGEFSLGSIFITTYQS